ncbi:OsmC family protein [Haloplanus aerogenes]|uniref:OsmC family peroxiredoxin n=1 Tax=Haloplanus aerogenes TaxID=660522 RepID=A0A3M0DRH0_9EURY|nr:OsmC family protein [Haloplanus aerogenes]AZH24312.1 OsmC family peroxiredoxin [Haloplanus aerogenes]RMB24054.1 putative OsmC-like protein [Haloplanus aerogenes]
MSLVDTTLQDRLNRRIEGLRTAREIKPGHPSVATETIRNYHARAAADGFVFDADEPVSKVGGTGTAPRPLRYFLAGFAFCLQAQYVRNAIRMGIDLDELSVDVDSEIDRRGGLGFREEPADFESIAYTTTLRTDAPESEVRDLVETAESCCYVHGTLSKAVELDGTTVLNGSPLE